MRMARLLALGFWTGILLFNAMSAYTTARGAQKIFPANDWFIQFVAPWAIGVGLALVLVYFTYLAFEAVGTNRLASIVAGYVLIASVSVFFNFTYLYSSISSQEISAAAVSTAQSALDASKASSFRAKRNQLEIPELIVLINKGEKDMEFENRRTDIPGPGPLWRAALARKLQAEGALKAAEQEMTEFRQQIATAIGDTPVRPAEDEFGRCQALLFARDRIIQIAQAAGLSLPPGQQQGFNAQDLAALCADPDGQHRGLQYLIEGWSGNPSSQTGTNRYGYLLAIFVAIGLDGVLFLGLVVTKGNKTPPESGPRPNGRGGIWKP